MRNLVKYEIVSNCDEALKILNTNGYTPINIEITNTSKPLRNIDFKELNKVALILGNERHGVSDEMLSKVKMSAHIDMYGTNSSLNVATALAIATYHISEEILKGKKVILKKKGALTM